MKDYPALIKEYIENTKKSFGCDIVIYDLYNLLCTDKEISSLPEIRKWHLNPYCLKIKGNPRLQKRCVYLKNRFQGKISEDTDFCSVTCYAGVTELSAPVFVKGKLFSIVSITGIKGILREKTATLLEKKLNCDIKALHSSSLLSLSEEERGTLNLFLEITSKLLYLHISNSPHYKTAIEMLSESDESPYVFSAIDYIKENYQDDIRLSDVAAFCHLSKSYLEHLFIKVKGHGISEEIRLLRLDKASELLKNTACSVRYAAISSGFKNVDYFSTAFKKHFGLTPLKYRKAK